MEENFKTIFKKIVEIFCHNFGKFNILTFLFGEKCHLLDVKIIPIWDYGHYLKAIVEKDRLEGK